MSNSNELTNAELALLNNLLYIPSITDKKYEKASVKEFIKDLRKKGIDKLDNPNANIIKKTL